MEKKKTKKDRRMEKKRIDKVEGIRHRLKIYGRWPTINGKKSVLSDPLRIWKYFVRKND